MNNLTLEEQSLLDSFERKEWISHPHLADRRQQLQEYADHTLQSQQTIEITLSKAELAIIEQFALKAGISSRALIVSVLHQFVINSSQWKLEEKVK